MPVGERKSGMPDSVLMPAPVSTTHGRRASISSARRSTLMPRIVELARGRLHIQDDGARPLRGYRRTGDRAQRLVSRLVRGRPRRVPARVRGRLPGAARPRNRGARARVALPVRRSRGLRRPPARAHPLRRPARCPLPLRVRNRPRRRHADGRRVHRSRVRRLGDAQADARAGLAAGRYWPG